MNLEASTDAKLVTVTLNAACVQKYSNVNATSLFLQFTSGNATKVNGMHATSIPTFAIGTNFKNFPVEPAQKLPGTPHFTYVSFDQYAFYQEVNGVPGFQPGEDTILTRQYLNDSLASVNRFDPYIKTSVDLDGNGNSYHKFHVQMLREFATSGISTSIETTSMDIYPFNSSLTLKYVSPNAMRFTTKIDGITNFPALASGCALSVVVCAPIAGFRQKEMTSMSGLNQTKDYPQDNNLDQMAWSLNDQGLANTTFFSIRRRVNLFPSTKPSLTSAVYWTEPINVGQTIESGLPLVNGTHSFWRIWLSIPQTSAVTDSFQFETGYGFDEFPVNSAASMGLSLLICLIIVLFY